MAKIFDTVKATLEEMGLHFRIEKDCMFCLGIQGENTNLDCTILCDDDQEIMIVSVSLPQKANKKCIDRMCRWITDTNYTTVLGAFSMDTNDGEICFRVSNTLDGGAINKKIIEVALTTALTTCDSKYPEIVKTIYMEYGENAQD